MMYVSGSLVQMMCESAVEGSMGDSESMSKAVGIERSNPLNNFEFPKLKGGNHKYLGGIEAGPDSAVGASTNSHQRIPLARLENWTATRKRKLESAAEKKVPLKFKLRTGDGMFNLQTETDKLTGEEFRKKAAEENENKEEEPEPPQTEAAGVRPWNLRSTKRAGLMAPIGGGSERELQDEKNIPNNSCLRTDNGAKLPRLKINFGNKEKTKFSVALSRKEIEEDFMKMTGQLPPRRSKKRPRAVQKQLDSLFPALWLPEEITTVLYKVTKRPHNGKT